MQEKINLYLDMDGCLTEFIVLSGQEQHRLYEKGYFRSLRPQIGVIFGLRLFMRQHPKINCYILSAYLRDSRWAKKEKEEWLREFFPDIPKAHWLFVPCGQEKSSVLRKGETGILLDDHSPNLKEWVKSPRNYGIKLINPINGAGKNWTGARIRYDLPPEEFAKELYRFVEKVGKGEEVY